MVTVFCVIKETKGCLLSFDTANQLRPIQIIHTVEDVRVKATKQARETERVSAQI